MNALKRLFAISLVVFGSFAALADDIDLSNVSSDDLKGIIKDFGTNFLYSPVAPASPMGSLFGFEVGLVAGQTQTPNIDDVSSGSSKTLMNAAVLGRVTIPFGITLGVGMIPEQSFDGGKFATTGLEAQWTLTEGFIPLPFDIALRGSMTNTTFKFTQDVSGTDAVVTTDVNSMAVTALASVNLMIIEPYAGIGIVNTDGKMKIGGSNSFFDSGNMSESSKPSSTQILLGAQLNLALLHFGLEYANMFGTSRYMAKFALGF